MKAMLLHKKLSKKLRNKKRQVLKRKEGHIIKAGFFLKKIAQMCKDRVWIGRLRLEMSLGSALMLEVTQNNSQRNHQSAGWRRW